MKNSNWFIKLTIGFSAVVGVFLIIFFLAQPDKKLGRPADNFLTKLKSDNRQNLAEANAARVVEVAPPGQADYLWGLLGAPAQLVVYVDFDCPFSARYFATLQKIKEEFANRVVIAWRHYPLNSHPNAILAAQAWECAREQNKADEMASALFDNQARNDNNVEGILAAATAKGLAKDKFKECLLSEKYKEKILSQKAAAKTYGVIGTPTTFLNGRNLAGAYQWDDFIDTTGRRYDGLKNLIEKEINK